jgi:NtrC-family two-component system sensor histidine kinase KinB
MLAVRKPFFHSLRFKIGFGYIVLVAINLAVTTWAIYNFARLTNALNGILSDNLPNVIIAENMARSVERHEHALMTMLNQDLDAGKAEFQSAKEEFYQVFDKANEMQSIPVADSILDNIQMTYEGYLIVSDSLEHMVESKQIAKAKEYYGNIIRPFSQRLSDNCFWLVEENQKEMARVSQETRATSNEATIAVLFAAIVATVLSVVTAVQFTKRIIEPAEQMMQTVHQIGRGRLDLKIDVDTDDEVGELSLEFNKMTERLRQFEEMNIEKIVSEKKKSETIVESISDAIIVCDADSNVQLINRSAEELLRIREQDVVGKPVESCVHDERLLDIFRHPDDEALTSRPYLQFNHRERPVYLRPRVSTIPTPHSSGRVGIVLVLQDVTQFRELDKMKSDFMAAVSHEFRTPLTSVNMSVDILRQQLLGPLTPPQSELLDSAKQDCERLTKLVRELLQLSKLESGKIEMREEVIDVRKVIGSTLEPLYIQFKEKNVALDTKVDEDLPSLIGDEQQLSWVVSNLVNNALRYTDSGGCVEISARREGENILVQVTDTGKGIPPEYMDKIFDKFVQVKQSLSATPGSVGLGLAIAKEIIEMYGGRIWVESRVGEGSTFSFRLPAVQGERA